MGRFKVAMGISTVVMVYWKHQTKRLDKYKRVLRTGQSASGVNRGFRTIDGERADFRTG